MKEKILEVKNASVTFDKGKKAFKGIDNISFDVFKGETFGLVGESGSGKTTTGRAIMGITPISEGDVYFNNHLIRGNIPSLKKIAKQIKEYLNNINENKNFLMKLINDFLNDFKKSKLSSPKLIKDIEDSLNNNLSYLIEVITNLDVDKASLDLLMTDKELDQKVLKQFNSLLNETYDFVLLIKKTMNEIFKLFNDSKQKPKEKELKELVSKIKLVNRISNSLLSKGKEFDSIKNIDKQIKHSKIFDKLDKKQNKELKKDMQMIFQDPGSSLNDRMNVEQIIGEGLSNFPEMYKSKEAVKSYLDYQHKNGNKKLTKKEVRYSDVKRFLIEQMLKAVGMLPEHLNRYPHEFSGGQKQRIGIARALIMKPEFIIADEPISSLDVSIRAQIINLLAKFQKEYGLTYIFIAHDLTVVRFLADRIGVIYHGKLVELADSEELFKHPMHPYTKALLNAIPIPNPKNDTNKAIKKYDEEKEHYDYLTEYPIWTEVTKGHFVYLNDRELKELKK